MTKKNSNDTIGNRTRDVPACRAVPQPTAYFNKYVPIQQVQLAMCAQRHGGEVSVTLVRLEQTLGRYDKLQFNFPT
jgi:hypothetical protein